MNAPKSVSPETPESTRTACARIESEILRRLASTTQARAASCMGVHPSTVSRMTEHIPEFSKMLFSIGLQIAPANAMVVDKDDQRALKRMAFNWLKSDLEHESENTKEQD